MLVNELRDFIFANYNKQIGFVKEKSYLLFNEMSGKIFFFAAREQINRKNI